MLYKNNIVFYFLVFFFCQNAFIYEVQAASASQNSNTSNGAVENANNHFHPQGKLPSLFTLNYQKEQVKKLPFEDKRDFEEVKKGFIAAPPYKTIMSEKGTVAWDMSSYDFLLTDNDFNSIHPSLSRQAILNMGYGLFEVLPDKIYQIRGFDIANMTLIKSATGWILIDVLTSKETAKAALAFANQKLGKRAVIAVIYSHSHGDHFGGAHGVMNEVDAKNGKIKVIAPVGFMEAAVSENIYAGNAMNRRMFYQYGLLLPRNAYGHVDQAIGKNVSSGTVGLIAPNYYIKKDFEKLVIDGVKLEFQNTPGTEAPSEMNIYFPELKAFWAAENITSSVHNIYTLRGALVRDALVWSKHINESLYRYGNKARVMFSSHTWPRWGNNRIQEVMRAQRDVYANLNNGVLNLANKGVTINEIHNVYQPPKSLQNQWAARSYHGSVEHNSRAVINRYLGYWDSNPATLIPLSPQESAPLYVEMMGGSEKILAKANQLYNEGKYLYAIEILNKLIYAQPHNTEAKYLLADVFEQIGYQKESTSLRNSFLAGALELRSGIPAGNVVKSLGSDLVSAMPTNLWLDYLAIRLNSEKADGNNFIINLETPDNYEKYVIELSNASMTNIKGFQSDKANLSIKVNRTELEEIIMGKSSFEEKINQGKIKLIGDATILAQLKEMIDNFSLNFEILPGTKAVSSI
ncbi:alkyl/aryl-sulfatase [Silvanigrella aquatica]|uniref:alkyl/aryl-sulfatase n=1 Tax=Silvanigrella aquatica TaxID=1915309 RepID=UPI000B08AFAE|nr:alkyl sulfatase dimerization domain-containing protein [Silvanigrella aquatica]